MKNRLQELLAAGDTAIGALVQLPSASVVEVLAQAGFDWLVIDTEHGPIDVERLQAMIRGTSETATTPFVRIASNLDWLAKRALDVGALGVMIPGVNSADEARAAVRAVRYPPEGSRGYGPTFAALRWGLPGADYVRQANDTVTAILQIEHIDAVTRIDDILSVRGIDLVLIGPNDLSGSMGLLGQVSHPEVQAAIDRVLKAAKKVLVPAGIFGVSVDEINRYIAQGFQAILAGVDVALLAADASGMLNQIKR